MFQFDSNGVSLLMLRRIVSKIYTIESDRGHDEMFSSFHMLIKRSFHTSQTPLEQADCPYWDEMAVKTLKDSLTIFSHPPEPTEAHRSLSDRWCVELRSRLHAFNMASIGKFHTPTTLKAHSSKAKHARNKRPARRESQEKVTSRLCQYLSSSTSGCRATFVTWRNLRFCQVCWSVLWVCMSVCLSVCLSVCMYVCWFAVYR